MSDTSKINDAVNSAPDTVVDKAAKATKATKAAATEMASETSDAAKISVAKVKEQATSMVGEATETARRAANQGKDMAAQALDELGKFADSAAKAVDERIGPQYGDYARKAAASVSDAATALHGKDIDDIVADTKAFVKKRPAVAIGALAAIGLLVTQIVRGAARGGSDDQA